jgi:hypothetical protein
MAPEAAQTEAGTNVPRIVEARDVPIKDLRFRCTKCGSRLTDSVVMAKDALQVQPLAV